MFASTVGPTFSDSTNPGKSRIRSELPADAFEGMLNSGPKHSMPRCPGTGSPYENAVGNGPRHAGTTRPVDQWTGPAQAESPVKTLIHPKNTEAPKASDPRCLSTDNWPKPVETPKDSNPRCLTTDSWPKPVETPKVADTRCLSTDSWPKRVETPKFADTRCLTTDLWSVRSR